MSLKMLREDLCRRSVQAHEWPSPISSAVDVLIAMIDKHRPLGPDGKHGDLHTDTCGCPEAQPWTTVDRLRELLEASGVTRLRLHGGYPQHIIGSHPKARDPEPGDVLFAECYQDPSQRPVDAELIVAAINTLPELLDVIEAAQTVVKPGFDIADNLRLEDALAALEDHAEHHDANSSTADAKECL